MLNNNLLIFLKDIDFGSMALHYVALFFTFLLVILFIYRLIRKKSLVSLIALLIFAILFGAADYGIRYLRNDQDQNIILKKGMPEIVSSEQGGIVGQKLIVEVKATDNYDYVCVVLNLYKDEHVFLSTYEEKLTNMERDNVYEFVFSISAEDLLKVRRYETYVGKYK